MAFLHWIVTVMCLTYIVTASTNSSDDVMFEIAYGEGTAVSVLKFRKEAFYEFHECLCNASNAGCLSNYVYEPDNQGFYVYETEFLESVPVDQALVTHSYYYSCRKMGLQKSLHCQRREYGNQDCGVEEGRESIRLVDNTLSSCGSSCVGIEWNSYQKMKIHDYDNTSLTIDSCKGECAEPQGTTTTSPAGVEEVNITDTVTEPSFTNSTTEEVDEQSTSRASTKPADGDATKEPTDERSTTDAPTTKAPERMETTESSSKTQSLPTSSPMATSTTTKASTAITSQADTSSSLLDEEGVLALVIGAAVLSIILVVALAIALIVRRKRRSSEKSAKYHLQMNTID